MRLLSLLGFGAFVVTSLVVGARLLLLAGRTRQAPEAAIGTALFAGAGLGYLLVIATMQLQVVPAAWSAEVRLVGIFCLHLGSAALAVGAWRIFRADQRWAMALCLAIAAGLALSFTLRALDPPTHASPASRPLHFWPMTLLGAISYGWSALESARYALLMRRRQRIGLGDPALMARFALWAAAGAGAVCIHLASVVNRWIDPATIHPTILAVQSVLGLAVALSIALAFFPPAGRRVRGVAATSPG